MIHRKKDFANAPTSLVDNKWDQLKRKVLIERNHHNANDGCYRDCSFDSLIQLYDRKCAICERKNGDEIEVDHYRPKKERLNINAANYNQPGYYWLTYEWSNLIPLCAKCNKSKNNRFPLQGWTNLRRIQSHINVSNITPFLPYSSVWLNTTELPLIVNPETDLLPERHFSYTPDGQIQGQTNEGRETINVCRLNRKHLVLDRREVKEKYCREIQKAFDRHSIHQNENRLKGALHSTFDRMISNCEPNSGFSLFNIYICKYFTIFIDDAMPLNLQGKVSKYFGDYLLEYNIQLL